MKRRKLKVKNLIIFIFGIICIIGLTCSTIDIIKWKLENDKTKKNTRNYKGKYNY